MVDNRNCVFDLLCGCGLARDQAAAGFRSEGFSIPEDGVHLQPLQRGLDIWKFKESSPVRDTFVVEHEAYAPDDGREADILGAGQVV